MKEIELSLIPQPGAKPEFLAVLQIVDPSPAVSKVWALLPEKIILEGYTRDAWAWKPGSGNVWVNAITKSVDGRNKLRGFSDYLKQRQKAAFARFKPVGSSPGGLFIVSFIQPKSVQGEKNRIECRLAVDMSKVPNCSLRPKVASATTVKNSKANSDLPPSRTTASTRKKGGLLGKLVGAQHRTNKHVEIATAKPAIRQQSQSVLPGTASASTSGGPSNVTEASVGPNRTAVQVFSEFRQSMADKMLDFDINPEEVLKVEVSMAKQREGLTDEEKTRVTADVLKYMVYEAAEEVNEEWVAIKEPSEFMDEFVIAVYKEGAAPPEVLEELNKGELPDEVRGQQQAIQQERQRQVDQAEMKKQTQAETAAHNFGDDDDEDLEALNSKKRDRRTMEDYQREKAEGTDKKIRAT